MRRWFWFFILTQYISYGNQYIQTPKARLRLKAVLSKVQLTANHLPATLPIELQVIDIDNRAITQTITTFSDADGVFIFENVPAVTENDFYVFYATYSGVRQQTTPRYASPSRFCNFPTL